MNKNWDGQTFAGKRPGRGVYVHVDAIASGLSNLNNNELAAYGRAIGSMPNFSHEFTHIFGDTVRLLRMSSLCVPHPHVIESMKVHVTSRKSSEGVTNGQIYHRLETMICPEDSTYAFHAAVTEFEEQNGLIGEGAPMKSMGSRVKWEAWIETKIGVRKYNQEMERLRRKHFKSGTPEQIEKVNRTATALPQPESPLA